MQSRRFFLKTLAVSGVGLFVRGKGMLAFAQIPGGTLLPGDVPKHQTPLLIPPVMPKAAMITQKGILPAGMPLTTVWGYGAVTSARASTIWYHDHALGTYP